MSGTSTVVWQIGIQTVVYNYFGETPWKRISSRTLLNLGCAVGLVSSCRMSVAPNSQWVIGMRLKSINREEASVISVIGTFGVCFGSRIIRVDWNQFASMSFNSSS